ncbi:MAG: hypothetical protein AAFR61_19940 [Bacteroidota bacterium]
MRHYNMKLSFISWLFIFGTLSFALGQAEVGRQKFKNFSTEIPWVYPFGTLDVAGKETYFAHVPALRISDGEVIHVWKPSHSFQRERVVHKLNVFMETQWKQGLELGREEELIHMYTQDSMLVILSVQEKRQEDQHILRAHYLDLDSGTVIDQHSVFLIVGKDDRELMFTHSPDSSLFMFFHFQHQDPNRKVSLLFDYVRRDGMAGLRVSNAARMHFRVLNPSLEVQYEGVINLGDKKLQTLDVQIDNEGNIYTASFQKPSTFEMRQFHRESETQRMLSYPDFAKITELTDAFHSHFPITVGQDQQVYVAVADRQKRGLKKGTRGYSILNFDFQTQEISEDRQVGISPGFMVQVQKTREEFGMRPLRNFDEFMIRNLIEMPDKSLWLVIQKYGENNLPVAFSAPNWQNSSVQFEMGEIVLIGFSPEGKADRALIVPSSQRVNNYLDRLGAFYHMDVDKASQTIRFILREASGKNLRGPEKIFLREVDLNRSYVSDRVEIYTSRRRTHYFLAPYTIWLNKDIVTFMTIEGDDGDAYGVTVNLEVEPEEEERKKWWKKRKQ